MIYKGRIPAALALTCALIGEVNAGGNFDIYDANRNLVPKHWDERLLPIEWQFSSNGYLGSNFSNAEVISEFTAAFDTWNSLTTSNINFTYGGEINRRLSSDDGVNLVTFTDTEYEFPPGAAGLAVIYSFDQETIIGPDNNDLDGDGVADIPNGTYPAGTIYDGDILFNSGLNYATDASDGSLDIRAIALHEIGHFVGLSHSSIDDAAMWPFINVDIAKARTPALDDIAYISRTYPQQPEYSQQYGSVTGTITNGSTGFPVLGAHVYAVDIDSGNKIIGGYSRPDGSYSLPVPAGNYYIGIEPLDGDPAALDPERINDIIATAFDTIFIEELYDINESSIEADPLSALSINVTANNTTPNINIQTNITSVPGVSRVLRPGVNYFSFPVEVPSELSAYDLLQTLGNENEINAIERLNRATQLYERVSYVRGVPSGKDFPIVRGEGYIIHAQQQKVVTFRGIPNCTDISLISGINLIAVPCPPASYTSFDLLQHLGSEYEVVALRRYNPETASFQVVEYSGGQIVGDEFFIANGEAYFAELRVDKSQVSVPGLGSVFPPAITGLSPGRGVANDLVIIQGEGFAESIADNFVSFNGVQAHVIFSSTTQIAIKVPANATTGPVVVQAEGRDSNEVTFVIESSTISEDSVSATTGTEILSGQTASGQLSLVSEQDRYSFIALEGALLSLNAQTVSGDADLMLALESPSGVILVTDDDSGAGNTPMIRNFTLPETGLYSVVVTAVSGVGSYNLSIDVLNTTTDPAISVLQGDVQSTVMGTDLPKPLEVYITSSTGKPLAGVPVTFTASNVDVALPTQGFSLQNAGTVVATTNSNGIAIIEATAPNTAGVFNIIVTVPGMPPATMQVSTTNTAVSQVIVSNQTERCGGEGCAVGEPVSNPYTITYLDSVGAPVANVLTRWKVVSGGGSLGSFAPLQGSTTGINLTAAEGSTQVVHTIGQQLFAEINGQRSRLKQPQFVAATVPGQLRPVLFSAQSKAGPPAKIESIGSDYVRMHFGTVLTNALTIQVKDTYDNPVEGAVISAQSDEIDVVPGLFNGIQLLDYETTESGYWVGLTAPRNDTPPTFDEFGNRGAAGLGDTYQVVLSEPTAGSLTFDVDLDMGPSVVSGSGQGLHVFVTKQPEQNPVSFNVFRYQRIDGSDDDDSWQNEDFSNLRYIPIDGVDVDFSLRRGDGVDAQAAGVVATTINNASEATITSDATGRAGVDVTMGDVGGLVRLIGTIPTPVEVQFQEDNGELIGTPVAFPVEEYSPSNISINARPIDVRVVISADQLSGLDWSTLQITLNGTTTVFDGNADTPPTLGVFPHFINVFIDGAEQLVWPSAELIAAGGFSELVIVYQPLGSDLIEGVNTLAINASVREFDGTVTASTEQSTFVFNQDLSNRLWEAEQSFNAESTFDLRRVISLAQIRGKAADPKEIEIGGYQIFNVPLTEPSSVVVHVLDDNKNQVSILINSATLPAGDHRFVLLREDLGSSIVPISGKPDLHIRVQTTPASTGQPRVKLYAGDLNDSVTGKMLGQVIQHDTLIQDGSLTLRREDMALKGAGPQLNFIRSYSNSRQPENSLTDLGPGWTHNHNIFLRVLASSGSMPSYSENLPGWIAGTRQGLSPRFLTASALSTIVASDSPRIASTVLVSNGGVFEINNSGVWLGQRGNHGSLIGNVNAGFVYTSKDGTVYTFNTTADNQDRYKVANIADRNNNTLTYQYDNFRLARVTDQAGRYLNLSYAQAQNNRRRLERVRVIADTSNLNSPQNFALQFNYFKRESDNPDEVANSLDEVGMLQSFTRDEFVESYDYNAIAGDHEPNLVAVNDVNGHTTQYQYLAPENVPANFNIFAPGTPNTDLVYRVCYPTASNDCSSDFAQLDYTTTGDNVRTITDLRGNATRYVLNAWGNPSRIEEPEGKTTEFDWSIDLGLSDNLMRVKRDLSINATWQYQYDDKGNLTLETDPFNQTIQQTWNQEFSILTSRTDKNGHQFSQVLDDNGNVRQEMQQAFVDGATTAANVTVGHTYGSHAGIHGLRLSTLDARSNLKEFGYDSFGNITSLKENGSTAATDSITRYTYSKRGLRLSETDANLNLMTYVYDTLDRLTLATDAEGNTVQSGYDAKGNKRFEQTIDSYQVDTNKHTRTLRLDYTYDERDRVTQIIRSGNLDSFYPISGIKDFIYDGNSNLTSEEDWKGVATTYAYDGLNRRTSTTNRLLDEKQTAYAWIANEGLRKTITDYETHDSIEHYDLLGRLRRVQHETVNNSDGTINNYQRLIEYDHHENITRIVDEELKETQFAYDPRYLKIRQTNHLGDDYVWDYDANGNLTKTIDEELSEITFVYDAQDRLIEKHEPEAHDWQYSYYPNDTLRNTIDPWGFEYSYTYDKINQRTSVTDPDGVTQEYHNKEGGLVFRRDAENRVNSSLYGPDGRLQVTTDGRGRTTTHTYDDNNNVTDSVLAWNEGATGPQSVTTHFEYDARDRLRFRHEAYQTLDVRRTEYRYDKQNNKTHEINPQSRQIRYVYDELYRVKTIITPATYNNLATDTLQKFDGVGNLVWTRDRRNHVSTITYDDLHRKEALTDALNQTVQYTYDKVGNVLNLQDKRGHSTETLYDDLYRVREQFVNDNAGERFRLVFNEYDLNNTGNGLRRNAVTDANGNRVTSDLDFRGNPERIELPAANDGTYGTADIVNEYDNTGLLISTTDAETFTTSRSYFDDGMLASITNHENESTRYECDIFGNRVIETKEKGNTQTSTFDARNRLVRVEDFQGAQTRFTYDTNSNLTLQESPAANDSGTQTRVRYNYDTLNRKRGHRQQKSGTEPFTQYTYDAEGNMTERVDANGQTFTYTYDQLNRLTQENFPTGDDITRIVHTYDANNNMDLVTENKPSGVEITDYNFDLLDRLISSTQRGHSVSYTYDNNGNRTGVSAPGGNTSYTYDSRNRLQTATAGGSTVPTTYSYLQNGWLDVVTHANITSVDYDYFNDGQIQTITNRAGVAPAANVISSFAYTYDGNNNRTQQVETQNGFATAALLTTDYDYDTLDRLERYTETSSDNSHNVSHTFTYFPSYDRKTEVVMENGIQTENRSFTYNQIYWLTGITETVNSGGTVTYNYDNNGNTLSKTSTLADGPASTVFTYNRRNQLKTVATGAANAEVNQGTYHYNYDGMRIRHLGSDRGDIEYIYDGQSIIDEVQNGSSSQVAHYRYGDRLLSLNSASSGEQFYHYASLGTTANLTNSAGEVQTSYRVDPFGEITQQEGSSINRQVFTGHEHDTETGLIYMKARYYDPDSARFINQDTYLGESGTPPSLHRYLYAYSNPTMYVDLNGYAATPYFTQAIDDTTLQIPRIGTIDTGNQFIDDNLAALATVGNIAISMANTIPAGLNAPLKTASVLSGKSQADISDSIMAHTMSTGSLAPILLAGEAPLLAGSKLSSVKRAMSKARGKARPSATTEKPNISRGNSQVTDTTSSANKYPDRTHEAQQEARKVVDAMDHVVSKKSNPAVNVFTHEDGRVSVGLSGDASSAKFQQNQSKLQEALDNKYGAGKYKVSNSTLDETNGVSQKGNGNKAGACAEPKCATASSDIDSPISGMSTQWRGKADNPHPYTGPNKDKLNEHLDTEMNPCATCAHPNNEKIYMDKANENK